MKLKRILATMLTAAMLTSMAAGCGEDSANNNSGNNGSTSAATGENGEPAVDEVQYYNSYMGADPSTLDPSKGSDSYGGSVLVNIIEPLTRVTDENGKDEVIGAGAESWEVSEDGLTWTFKIREGNKWDDGQPVTAKDYAYGIIRSLTPATGSETAYLLDPIKNASKALNGEVDPSEVGVSCPDDYTLVIELEAPTPYFLSLTYQRAMYPQRQDYVEKYGDTYGADMGTIAQCGPFLLSAWVHDSDIQFVKNENYWDKDNVKLQNADWKIIKDENALMNSFDNGSIDSVNVSKAEWRDRFSKKEDAFYTETTNTQTRYQFYNCEDKVFKNPKIRQAFSLAVDREEMADVIYDGMMVASYGWIPKNVSAGEGVGEYRSLVEEPLLTLKKEVPDPKALLIEGMKEEGLGDDPSQLDVTFMLAGNDQWFRTYGEYMQQTYKRTLGVNLKIDFYEWPVFSSKVHDGDYQFGYMAWGIEYNDPNAMLSIMMSNSNSIEAHWASEEYDNLIIQARAETDPQKRVELYAQAEKILIADEAVLCPVINSVVHNYCYNYVKGVSDSPFSTIGMKNIYTAGRP